MIHIKPKELQEKQFAKYMIFLFLFFVF